MLLDDFRHSLLCPGQCCVRDYINPTGEAEVTTYCECLPTVSHYITTEGTLYNLPLVVHSKTMVADNGAQLMRDLFSQ